MLASAVRVKGPKQERASARPKALSWLIRACRLHSRQMIVATHVNTKIPPRMEEIRRAKYVLEATTMMEAVAVAVVHGAVVVSPILILQHHGMNMTQNDAWDYLKFSLNILIINKRKIKNEKKIKILKMLLKVL